MSTEDQRCFLCGARALAPTDRTLRWPNGFERRFRFACGFCGVLTDGDDGAADHLGAALADERFRLPEEAPYGLDPFTLRTAATRWRRAARTTEEAQRAALVHPHSDLAAEAGLSDLRPGEGPPVALGLMCRAGEGEAALAALLPHLAWAAGIVILVDGEGAEQRPQAGVVVTRRRMAGDFAAQRNALQDLSPAPWMLQLDADETLGLEAGARLPALAALCEEGGAVSVGLPRRNLVDGVLSDLYPDTQYRLNRRAVRYAGTVHERPDRPWQRSLVALDAAIDHHLTRAHVETRSQAYETLAPGGGRLEEAGPLLQPFRA